MMGLAPLDLMSAPLVFFSRPALSPAINSPPRRARRASTLGDLPADDECWKAPRITTGYDLKSALESSSDGSDNSLIKKLHNDETKQTFKEPSRNSAKFPRWKNDALSKNASGGEAAVLGGDDDRYWALLAARSALWRRSAGSRAAATPDPLKPGPRRQGGGNGREGVSRGRRQARAGVEMVSDRGLLSQLWSVGG